jgi:TetR/AcrR family transcriptional regulator, cholesterol catabolism regulator
LFEKKVSIVLLPIQKQLMEARERILVKAHELFNRLGIRRVTMDEIALKTGMSKKTIYQSFANKDELVDAVLEDHLSKNCSQCEGNKTKADNAVHEIFLNIDMVQELMAEMNPTIFYDLEKFHPASFMKLYKHKNNYLFKMVKENLEWGIKDGLFREDINVDVITKVRLETMFLPFNQEVFPYGKYNLADVEKQTLEHYLYGIATIKAHKLIDKYKQQRLKTT